MSTRRTLGERAAILCACVCAACTSPRARESAQSAPRPSGVHAARDDARDARETAGAESIDAPADAATELALSRFASGSMPTYPPQSERLGEQGSVVVELDVREDGEVLRVAIATSSGYARLDEAVLTAARTWRFFPRTGERGVDRMRHRIVFELTPE